MSGLTLQCDDGVGFFIGLSPTIFHQHAPTIPDCILTLGSYNMKPNGEKIDPVKHAFLQQIESRYRTTDTVPLDLLEVNWGYKSATKYYANNAPRTEVYKRFLGFAVNLDTDEAQWSFGGKVYLSDWGYAKSLIIDTTLTLAGVDVGAKISALEARIAALEAL